MHRGNYITRYKGIDNISTQTYSYILHRDTGIFLRRNIGIVVHRDTGIFLHRNICIVLHSDTRISLHKNIGIILPGYINMILTNIWYSSIQGYWYICTQRY